MDRWVWKGIYKDGTVITQGDWNLDHPKKKDTGGEWSSDHLDLTKLKAVKLESQNSGQPDIYLEFREGDTFRRFWRQYPLGDGTKITCWGLKITRDGTTFYNFFRPDGSWVVTTNPEGSELEI
jgi:hypothetical protein